MALRKPSDLFNKKETSGIFESPEVSSHITESYDKFRDNFDKVNQLSEKVEFLSQELSEKLTKSDLENAMLSQLMVLDENFKVLQNQVKGLNKQDLKEFKETVVGLSEIVDNLLEKELPKYKKQITKNELYVGEQVNQLQGIVETNISDIREEIDEKFDNIADIVDNNIEYFNQKLEETTSQVKKTSETYVGISKILENKLSKENEKFEQYSELIDNLSEAFEQLSDALKVELNVSSQLTEEKFKEYRKEFESISSNLEASFGDISSNLKASVNVRLEDYHKEILDIKSDVVIFEKHNRNTEKTIQEFSEELSKISKIDDSVHSLEENVELLQSQYEVVSNKTTETKKDLELIEQYIQSRRQDIVELKEEVFTEIEKLPVGNLQENIERLEKKIDYIKETYSKIEPEVVVKEVIKEGLLNEPPETDNSDPLTPLNQNFVTLDQLQEHYRLFINRIQQQLSTIGGGGETQLKYLDDIVGIATNPSAYSGKFLRYNHSLGKFEFVTVSAGDWISADVGIYTLSNVGIGLTNPTSALTVSGNTSLDTLDVFGVSNFADYVEVTGISSFNDDSTFTAKLTAHELSLSKVTSLPDLAAGEYSNTINFGNDFIIFHLEDETFGTSNRILVNENNLIIGSIGEFGGGEYFSNLITVSVGNDVGFPNTSNVSLGYGDGITKLQTIGAGVTVTGTTFTNQLSVSGVSTFSGNVRVGVNTSSGVILTSPNGTQYRLIVDDGGSLSTVLVS